MAIRSVITCQKCGKEKEVIHSVRKPAPDVCSECESAEEDSKKQKALAKLKKLSLEERVAKLEEFQYDEENAPPPWDGRLG